MGFFFLLRIKNKLMAMKHCKKCLELNCWTDFKKLDDGMISTTCSNCGLEVQFMSKQLRNKLKKTKI